MAWHDSNQGQGNWRHDDCGDQEVAELPDHQHVDQNECDRKGNAHISERFIGDRPFTGPLESDLAVVRWRTCPVTLDSAIPWGTIVTQLLLNLEHAIDGRRKTPHRFRRDVFERPKILVKNGFILRNADKIAQLGEKYRSSASGGHRQKQQPLNIRSCLHRHPNLNEVGFDQ